MQTVLVHGLGRAPAQGSERLRRRRQRVRDVGEDPVHRTAGQSHGTDRDERDQRDEQCVLEQVLPVFLARERLEVVDHCLELLEIALGLNRAYAAAVSAFAMLVKIWFTAPPASVTAPIAMSAMSATSSAYSSRSW